MTSPRALYANRANARASTGPRTAAGKTRSARNARRHGLSVPVLRDPALVPEIESLARRIAGENASRNATRRPAGSRRRSSTSCACGTRAAR